MGRTVRELLGVLDSRELTEWMAFDAVEPIGGRRGDVQAAVVASTMANIWRGKDGKALGVQDFLPEYGPRVRREQKPDVTAFIGQLSAMGWMDASGTAAAAGDNPDVDDDDERLRGAGADVVDDGDGVGRSDSADGGGA